MEKKSHNSRWMGSYRGNLAFHIAILCNSTIIEMYDDMILVNETACGSLPSFAHFFGPSRQLS